MINIIVGLLFIFQLINSLVITEYYKSLSDCNAMQYPIMIMIYNMDTTGTCDRNLWDTSSSNNPYFTTTCEGKFFNMTYWDDEKCTIKTGTQSPLESYADVCEEIVNSPGTYKRARCDVQTYTAPEIVNRIWFKEYKNFDGKRNCTPDANMTHHSNTYYIQGLYCSKITDDFSYYVSCSNNGQMGLVFKDTPDCKGPNSDTTFPVPGLFPGGAIKTCIHDTTHVNYSRYLEECNSAFSIFSGIVGFVLLCLFLMF